MDAESYSKALACLDKAQVGRLLKHLGQSEKELDDLSKITLAVADWITHLGMFSDAQMYRALGFIKPALSQFSNTPTDHPSLACTVVVCDGRWVSCSNADGFLDAENFEEVAEMPDIAVTHIVCDVRQLYSRMEARTRHIMRKESPDAV